MQKIILAVIFLFFYLCTNTGCNIKHRSYMGFAEMTGQQNSNGIVPVKIYAGRLFFIADIDLSISEYESFKTDNYIPVRIVLRGYPKVTVWLCGQAVHTEDRMLLKNEGISNNMYTYLREESPE